MAPGTQPAYRSAEFWAGLLLALPLAVPREPFYWLSFAALGLVLPGMRPSRTTLLALVGLMGACFLSVVLTPLPQFISLFRAFYSTFFFCLVLFGCAIRRRHELFAGYSLGVTALSVLVILAWLGTGQARHGIAGFLMPVFRLWGLNIFPDWPNFLAFSLALGCLISLVFLRSPVRAGICGLAAILTTSRTGMLGVAIALLAGASIAWQSPRWRKPLIVAGLLILAVAVQSVSVIARSAEARQLVQTRLLKTADREAIYQFSMRMVSERPLFGYGHVLLNEELGAPKASFHNAYLEVLIRHGALAMPFWLALLFPLRLWRADRRRDWPIIAFFVVAAFFNTIFKHPHLLMMYAAVVLGPRDEDGAA